MVKLIKAILLMGSMGFILSACATGATPQENAQLGFITACNGYETSVAVLDGFAKQKLLSASEVGAILKVEQAVSPLCNTSTIPTNTAAAEQAIATEMLTINQILTAHQGGK